VLYWERANAAGALSAMIVGGVLYAVLATLKVQFLGFHPIVPALLLSLLAFVAGTVSAVPHHSPYFDY
jgi:sodium/pantothenate symporter